MNTTDRIKETLETLKIFSATTNGVTRLPFTKEAKLAVNFLKQKMEEAGLKVFIDASGAIHGIRPGISSRKIIIGSHYDSVKSGGAYDGIAGVVCGIEIARLLKYETLFYTLEIIGFNDEEGVRFGTGFFSSKAFLGEWNIENLKHQYDEHGVSVYDAMKSWNLIPEQLTNSVWDLSQIRCFMEIHIEQGPVLEKENVELGIVNGIVGMKRYNIQILGRADHAGTTPMNMRYDALAGTANIIEYIEKAAKKYAGAVATVGVCTISPNAVNTVPEKVEFSLDIRSMNSNELHSLEKDILKHLEKTVQERNLTYEMQTKLEVEASDMDDKLKSYLRQSVLKLGYSSININSGAGHDALPISRKLSTAMLFVPSKDGRSHCPEEYSKPESLAKTVHVMLDTIKKINNEENINELS
ncbi:MAG: M20 family metallo-hydrolase [Megamonas funiformis]|uniref:M20 family metallo-hydrolase n=1 Tax=Megamonas funiformis TaxID=437897 RepID=UPI0039951A7A